MGELAACATFVAGIAGAPVRLVAPGPFAPNVGTVLDGKPAVKGFCEVGAAVEVPVLGNSGLAPDEDVAPGTGTWEPVAFVGVNPA